jgi:hypothetical protein
MREMLMKTTEFEPGFTEGIGINLTENQGTHLSQKGLHSRCRKKTAHACSQNIVGL